MLNFTAFTRSSQHPLPPKLELLSAPVLEARHDAAGDLVGWIEGVLVDSAGRIAEFIVRLGGGRRSGELVLVPLAAVEIGTSSSPLETRWHPIVRLLWSRDQLLAQPTFLLTGEPPRQELLGGRTPEVGTFLPARPNVAPPGSGVNRPMAARAAAGGGLLGGIAGLLVGLVTTGPLGALALGTFFAFGGGIAGAIAGASRDSAADASELSSTSRSTTAGTWQVRALEQELGRTAGQEGILCARVVSLPPERDERGETRRNPDREASPRS